MLRERGRGKQAGERACRGPGVAVALTFLALRVGVSSGAEVGGREGGRERSSGAQLELAACTMQALMATTTCGTALTHLALRVCGGERRAAVRGYGRRAGVHCMHAEQGRQWTHLAAVRRS